MKALQFPQIPESFWQQNEKVNELLHHVRSTPTTDYKWNLLYAEWREAVHKLNKIIDSLYPNP
jgi:hypothetical protein